MICQSIRTETAAWIRFDEGISSTRPTHRKLWAAMGIAACIVALFAAALGLLTNLPATVFKLRNEGSAPLTVTIDRRFDEPPAPEQATDDPNRPSTPDEANTKTEQSAAQQNLPSTEPGEQPAESQPARDWRGIAELVAKATVDDHVRREETRAARWRQSPSVMFESADEAVVETESAIIRDFEFKPQFRVIGIGMTIGSCFYGVPLAGVPVEQRQVAITLFVCAEGSQSR